MFSTTKLNPDLRGPFCFFFFFTEGLSLKNNLPANACSLFRGLCLHSRFILRYKCVLVAYLQMFLTCGAHNIVERQILWEVYMGTKREKPISRFPCVEEHLCLSIVFFLSIEDQGTPFDEQGSMQIPTVGQAPCCAERHLGWASDFVPGDRFRRSRLASLALSARLS